MGLVHLADTITLVDRRIRTRRKMKSVLLLITTATLVCMGCAEESDTELPNRPMTRDMQASGTTSDVGALPGGDLDRS